MREPPQPAGPDPGGPAVAVVIAAAGAGRRYGAKKQFLALADRPLLHWSLDVFAVVPDVLAVVVAAPAADLGRVEELIASWRARGGAGERPPEVAAVAGGARRQDSVRRGLEALPAGARWVLVHDAVRPLVRRKDVEALIAAVRSHGAAVLGYPSTDSVKEEREGRVLRSLPRERIWQVQTPQGAARRLLEEAYRVAAAGQVFTDEVSLLERAGIEVRLVEGSRENIKVTLPGDEALAEFLLRRRG